MMQNNLKIIGITGGMATGKSTVSNIIKELGYKVVDADKIARDVVKKGQPAYDNIIDYFGKDIVDENGDIKRKALGKIIFNDNEKREKLNNITHPYIFKTIKESIIKYKDRNIIFVDVPLLIEQKDKFNEYNIYFDEIWLVYVDERTQLDRLMERDSISREEGIQKIKAQMSIELKRKYATKIIDNRGDIKTLEEKVKSIINESR